VRDGWGADDSYLFCWIQTGREEVTVICNYSWETEDNTHTRRSIMEASITCDRDSRCIPPMSRQADTLIVVHNHIIVKQIMYKHTHSLYAVLRGYHQLPSFSLTTLTNLVINLSLSLLSPSRYNPFKKGVISSGLHLARVRNKSANRIAGCKGRV
jgi:hypothetical protein